MHRRALSGHVDAIKKIREEPGELSDMHVPPFLTFNKCPKSISFRQGTTVLASYPRSGNTLVRSLLESVTGCVTGSDTRPDRPLSLALAEHHDLVGEGVIHPNKTPIVKTHWPERIGYQSYSAQRVILLVRNPFDAIDSYWNLNLTNTHTEKVVEEVYKEHFAFFTSLALNEMKVWLDFLNFWGNQTEVPILWLRYEDLICHTQQQLLRLLSFLTNQDSNFWYERVSAVLEQKRHGYKSRAHTRPSNRALATREFTFGKSMQNFKEDLLKQMHDLDADGWLKRFGYNVYLQDFPRNIERDELPPLPTSSPISGATHSHIQVNRPKIHELRSRDSPYGRNMRDWRRTYTMDDTVPFPTVQR